MVSVDFDQAASYALETLKTPDIKPKEEKVGRFKVSRVLVQVTQSRRQTATMSFTSWWSKGKMK